MHALVFRAYCSLDPTQISPNYRYKRSQLRTETLLRIVVQEEREAEAWDSPPVP